MRVFIVLCLVAAVFAGKPGYNYRQGVGSDSDLSLAGVDGIGGGGSGGIGGLDSVLGGSSNLAPSLDGGSFGPSGGSSGSHDSHGPQGAGELKKEFFTYTANDDDFQEPNAAEEASQYLKQGIRVVFIKGPEKNGLEDAALALAKHAAEQHTAIYVLNKQADIAALANKLNAVRDDNNNQPEVHFVKYRTPEDAANAQKQIQSEYDNLGGASESHDGGVAPVINFASKAPAPSGGGHGGRHSGGRGGHGGSGLGGLGGSGLGGLGGSGLGGLGGSGLGGSGLGGLGGSGGHDGSGSAPGSTYLPASIIRRFRQ